MTTRLELKELFAMSEMLRGANLSRYTIQEIEEALGRFLHTQPVTQVTRSSAQMWYRGRKYTPDAYKLPTNVQECLYPKQGDVKGLGRANYPGRPVFYASWNASTVVAELAPDSGDVVHLVAVRPREGIEFPCHVVGELHHMYMSGMSLVNSNLLRKNNAELFGKLSEDELLRVVFIDAFLAEQWSRRVERPHEYKLTAAYYASLLRQSKTGIMYPSVQACGGMNLAVDAPLFDENFEVMWTQVDEVIAYGSGIYKQIVRNHSCDFALDGTILWDSKKDLEFSYSIEVGVRLKEGTVGWRMPRG